MWLHLKVYTFINHTLPHQKLGYLPVEIQTLFVEPNIEAINHSTASEMENDFGLSQIRVPNSHSHNTHMHTHTHTHTHTHKINTP